MSKGKSILIVEDEGDLAETIKFHLDREGYVCRRSMDGQSALAEAQARPPDLVLLDRMLPRLSGDDVVARLKRDSRTARIPVIMLTAKAADEDELVGFALGADDYVRKPFAMKLLLARVASVLRRDEVAGQEREVLAVGPLTLDRGRHEVTVDGVAVGLTAMEFRILAVMMAGNGRVLEREQLIDQVLGVGAAVTNRTIDVHIAALRKKLGRAAGWVQTVRGVGYTYRNPQSEPTEEES